MLDVHRAEIACLPIVKLCQVNRLYKYRNKHGVADVAVEIILLESIANYTNLPKHNTKSGISKLLHIEP